MKDLEIKGIKLNMSQIFREDGRVIPVTLIQVDKSQELQEDLKNKEISITGTSKGKGFGGVMRRHGYKHQHVTRGSSNKIRTGGSIGNQTPGKVFKGKTMAGHLGNVRVTIHGVKIIDLIENNSVVLVAGSVPGARNSSVVLKVKE